MWIPGIWSQMTPQSASGLSTLGIPSALRREEVSRPGHAHPSLSAQSAGTPAPGFLVCPLRPPKLDPYAPLRPVRLVRPSPPRPPVRPDRPNPPCPGFHPV